MESSIAFAIGIGLNRSLRSRLRALAGASESQPIFVRHMRAFEQLQAPSGRVHHLRVARGPDSGVDAAYRIADDEPQDASVSSMRPFIVRAQRPHSTLQPRQP